MTYRRTDFGNAEQEQNLQKASTMLFGIQRGVLDTQARLAAGHLEDGFRAAQTAQKRLDEADRFIRRTAGLPASVIEGLNVARVQVTRMWSRFDSDVTGRAALRKGFAGIGDDLMSAGKSALSTAKEYASEVKQDVADVKAMIDDFKNIFGGGGEAPAPVGTPFTLPTCYPAGASLTPIQLANAVAFGIQQCAPGASPKYITFVAGESMESIRTKVAQAQAGSSGIGITTAYGPPTSGTTTYGPPAPGTTGSLPGRFTGRTIGIAPYGPGGSTGGGGGGITSKATGFGIGALLGLGFAAKLLFFR